MSEKNPRAVALGRLGGKIGGKVKSEKKARAARKNAKRPRKSKHPLEVPEWISDELKKHGAFLRAMQQNEPLKRGQTITVRLPTRFNIKG